MKKLSAAEAARAKLRVSFHARTYVGVGTWIKDRPDAIILVEAWLELRASGETDWPMGRLHRELREQHGLPYCSTAFSKWISMAYGQAYQVAMGRS